MDLEKQLTSEQYEHLMNILDDVSKKHVERHVKAFGSATGLSHRQYLNKFDIPEYQIVEKKWFTKNFKGVIYDKVFPTGPPDSFEPGLSIRDSVFMSGVVIPVRREFMCLILKNLLTAIRDEWQSYGAKDVPDAALYF
jgi:hypothetical protein|tara:strand:- start:2142 stop:2555 length:414 start_codon:yes stop_codon:yes gene_type:complete